MKKSVVGVILILVLFLITSCGNKVPGGEKPVETAAAYKEVHSGTQGVEISFLSNSPPPLIYDTNELITLVEVQNKGNDDILPQECFVQATGFDPSIITGGFGFPRLCAENLNLLEGKNIYNLKGGINQLELRSSSISLSDIPQYNANIKFTLCYNYHTKATTSVCVDPLFYQVSSEQKACNYRNSIVTGGGQGGPVGVGYVGVDMIGNRAIFEINIKNMGSGKVLSPYTDLRSCGSLSLGRQDMDKVGYTVRLGSGGFGDCKPQNGLVQLHNGQGKILCKFNVPGAVAYETPLSVDLDYNYLQSYDKPIQIVKTPE